MILPILLGIASAITDIIRMSYDQFISKNMGTKYPRPKSSMDDIIDIIPYLSGNTDRILSVDPDISLDVRPSELPSKFIDGRNMGLFTLALIPEGTIISSKFVEESKMNDAMVDLTDILQANTSEQIYHAWMSMKNTYYDIKKTKRDVNVRMIMDGNRNIFYEAIQDIPANKELVRIYGFTTWVLEILDILTNKTIVGFAQFIDELSKVSSHDPYEFRILSLRDALGKYGINNIFAINRVEYDANVEDQQTVLIGERIKELFLEAY